MVPVMSREPALEPTVVSLSNSMLPAQVLLPATLSRAPSAAAPVPLRIRFSRMGLVTLLTCSWELACTVVGLLVSPRALALVMRTMPPLVSRVIAPMKPLLSAVSTRVPKPSLVRLTPVVPESRTLTVTSAPEPTV
jgi:hypothetical protein